MKLYKRIDFIKLPEMTIYSRVNKEDSELMHGLFCKVDECGVDFIEQDLIAEPGFPNGLVAGEDAIQFQLNLRDTFKDFRTDLDCAGRDCMFDDEDVFVVWDKEDITKLRDYLNNVLNHNK